MCAVVKFSTIQLIKLQEAEVINYSNIYLETSRHILLKDELLIEKRLEIFGVDYSSQQEILDK